MQSAAPLKFDKRLVLNLDGLIVNIKPKRADHQCASTCFFQKNL